MRISGFERFTLTNHYMSDIQTEMVKKQIQIANGKAFEKVSDDPTKVNQSMLLVNNQNRLIQYQNNIMDAKTISNVAEIAITSSIDAVQIARETALQASNGTHNSIDLETFAGTVDGMIEQIVDLANTKHGNRYIFSGLKFDQPAFTYDGATATYNGDSNEFKMVVSAQTDISVSPLGSDVFQDTIDTLIKLRDEIIAGNGVGIRAAIGGLDSSLGKMNNEVSDIGVNINTLDTLNEAYEQRKLDLVIKRGDVENADISEVVSEYAQLNMRYQAVIQSSMMMMKSSILNYI